jgi:diguanylate cyclase (GGDEF)-like protein
VTLDPAAAREGLRRLDPALATRFADRIATSLDDALRAPGLAALVDADAPPPFRERFGEAHDRGVQVTTPLIAKLLFAFGPVDASRKPDLLQTLSEILESYNLTIDRRALLNRILQIAVGATGADRGSLLLWDEAEQRLHVEVAIGIEKEVIPKIRLAPGEGIAGKAFAESRAILLTGKPDRSAYQITREREDVESAISAPLVHQGRVLGVMNVSHGRRRGAFTEEDLEFVEQLARLDAKIIARAEEYHSLLRESATLRAQAEVRRLLAGPEPLAERLERICRFIAGELEGGLCHLYLLEPELDLLVLAASSTGLERLAAPGRRKTGIGVHGWVARKRLPVVLCEKVGPAHVGFAVLPLVQDAALLGVLSFECASERATPELLREQLGAAAEALASELHDALRAVRMEREATRTAAITELSARMANCADSAELHRMITSSAGMILEAEHALLRLQDDGTGRFQLRSYFGSAETDAQVALFALEKELAIEAIRGRAILRVADLTSRPALNSEAVGVSTALVQPLRRDGRVIGTLSVLGRAAHELPGAECFVADDEKIMARLVEHAQSALAAVHERERTRRRARFDDLTGLPNAVHLRERLEEEIARSSGRGRSVALARLRVLGLAELLERQGESEGDRVVLSIAQEIRGGLRDFDVLARTAPDTFEMLLPEPESEVSALLGPLARRAREAIRREPDATLTDRLALELGYAVYPQDGATARALADRAAEPRIRSV